MRSLKENKKLIYNLKFFKFVNKISINKIYKLKAKAQRIVNLTKEFLKFRTLDGEEKIVSQMHEFVVYTHIKNRCKLYKKILFVYNSYIKKTKNCF